MEHYLLFPPYPTISIVLEVLANKRILMKVYQFLLISLLILCFACGDKDISPEVLEDCPSLATTKIISEKDKENTCFYLEIYEYQSEIYTICECCVCDKFSPPINCNGASICESIANCMTDFWAVARYLYSVVPD